MMTGVEMRNAQRVEFWKRHLEGWRASGQTQQVYCRERGVSFKTFARYRDLIGREGKGQAAATLIPVSVKPAAMVKKSPASAVRADSIAPIEVRLRNARTIVVTETVDESRLARLVRLLETLPC
jgi:hypothetical protein